jgi:uncharacterized protein (TIGR02001 family)
MRTRDQQMRFGLGAAGLLAMLVTPALGSAQTEMSANVGWVSEYIYRGIPQKASSGSFGLDIAGPYVSVGTWAADVGDGNEIDLYAGVGTEYDGFSVSVGGIGYFYTGGFDDTYLEGNLNAGYGALSVEYSIGTYRTYTEHRTSAPQRYSFIGITLEGAGLYATFGTFGGDFEGEYFETGYGLSVGDLDISAAWVSSSRKLLGDTADNTLVVSVGHTIEIL